MMSTCNDAQHWRWGNADDGQCWQRWAVLATMGSTNDGQYWQRCAALMMGNTDGGWHWQRWGITDNDGQH